MVPFVCLIQCLGCFDDFLDTCPVFVVYIQLLVLRELRVLVDFDQVLNKVDLLCEAYILNNELLLVRDQDCKTGEVPCLFGFARDQLGHQDLS